MKKINAISAEIKTFVNWIHFLFSSLNFRYFRNACWTAKFQFPQLSILALLLSWTVTLFLIHLTHHLHICSYNRKQLHNQLTHFCNCAIWSCGLHTTEWRTKIKIRTQSSIFCPGKLVCKPNTLFGIQPHQITAQKYFLTKDMKDNH